MGTGSFRRRAKSQTSYYRKNKGENSLSSQAIPDDDDHASFIRIPPPLRKSAARFFVKDKAVTRFWEKSTSEKTKNSTSTPAEVASAAAAL